MVLSRWCLVFAHLDTARLRMLVTFCRYAFVIIVAFALLLIWSNLYRIYLFRAWDKAALYSNRAYAAMLQLLFSRVDHPIAAFSTSTPAESTKIMNA